MKKCDKHDIYIHIRNTKTVHLDDITDTNILITIHTFQWSQWGSFANVQKTCKHISVKHTPIHPYAQNEFPKMTASNAGRAYVHVRWATSSRSFAESLQDKYDWRRKFSLCACVHERNATLSQETTAQTWILHLAVRLKVTKINLTNHTLVVGSKHIFLDNKFLKHLQNIWVTRVACMFWRH